RKILLPLLMPLLSIGQTDMKKVDMSSDIMKNILYQDKDTTDRGVLYVIDDNTNIYVDYTKSPIEQVNYIIESKGYKVAIFLAFIGGERRGKLDINGNRSTIDIIEILEDIQSYLPCKVYKI
ncbi:MAG TPA: hypothetical protein PLW93_00260, partial [Candidatus Absconditabacterales bacterium]|nr:hypothetical protein [Candidatus Absconditabacterales bacterium]